MMEYAYPLNPPPVAKRDQRFLNGGQVFPDWPCYKCGAIIPAGTYILHEIMGSGIRHYYGECKRARTKRLALAS